MGLPFTWFCKSSMTILYNGFRGQGQKQLPWESESYKQHPTLDCYIVSGCHWESL